MTEVDMVNHPPHYNGFSNGAEAIDILENLAYNCGNAAKYLIRAGRPEGLNKSDTLEGRIQDIDKSIWYATRERERLAEALKAAQGESDSPNSDISDVTLTLWVALSRRGKYLPATECREIAEMLYRNGQIKGD